ncbi:MAG: metallophosphoesterase [Prevotella sp.]|uniref:metallophosphoesterase n=1 Tax=Prevotella sp. TaxID=59823 RepID=UPI002A25AC25|nr:metallophosphoesterase [Prevotella sp.]MDD7317481.1 metallophosphoesterase [Prevotellaceae bacterium]MDY4019183.1 metallophosphoesterase [Prevotella sp.]
MIARYFIFIILLVVFPFLYVDFGMMRNRWRGRLIYRVLWWLPCVAMLVYTVYLATLCSFAPLETWVLFLYLLILGIVFVPLSVFAMCAYVGDILVRKGVVKRNRGRRAGVVAAVTVAVLVLYGSFWGNKGVKVRHVEYYSERLPEAFNGYRIALFSDAHVGSYIWGSIGRLQDVADTLNSQHADMIAFTGDLQNMHPDELPAAMPILEKLRAKDGVFSVLGNHDYDDYMRSDSVTGRRNEQLLRKRERQMGWQLLIDENVVIKRRDDSIFVAGMHNDGKEITTYRANPEKAMSGVPREAFSIMLEHTPTSWQRTILPRTTADLTLSGHTHGGQINIAGLSPAAVSYDEYDGMYIDDSGRALFVTTGIGGFVPFRLGVRPEVVVITLRKGKGK